MSFGVYVWCRGLEVWALGSIQLPGTRTANKNKCSIESSRSGQHELEGSRRSRSSSKQQLLFCRRKKKPSCGKRSHQYKPTNGFALANTLATSRSCAHFITIIILTTFAVICTTIIIPYQLPKRLFQASGSASGLLPLPFAGIHRPQTGNGVGDWREGWWDFESVATAVAMERPC